MYKKLLVTLDGSKFAERNLENVRIMAIDCKVPEVILLRVVEPSETAFRVPGISEEFINKGRELIIDDARNYLAKIAAKLKKEGIVVETVVVVGLTADKIVEYAENNKVDLIIMNTHGRTGISRWAMGSVADKVIRDCNASVLMSSPRPRKHKQNISQN
ncbi:universal stress protein [Chloroflexota bacterium]